MNTVEKIIALIKEKGIDEKTFLNDVGLNKSSLSDWKKGTTKSYIRHIDKIAKYFNVSTDYLLGNTADPTIPEDDEVSEYIDVLHKRGEMRMLFSVARNATKEDIEKAVKIIEALRDNQWGAKMDDTIVRYVDLPCSVRGVTVLDFDGNYNVYINSRLSYDVQQGALEHELNHIKNNDFYCCDCARVIEDRVKEMCL